MAAPSCMAAATIQWSLLRCDGAAVSRSFSGRRATQDRLCLPEVDEKALAGLKFSEALPRHLAVANLLAVRSAGT